MKYLKITLISVAIVAVGGFAYKLYSPDTDDIEKVESPDNTFINTITQQIDDIKNSPKNKFSKELYSNTIYLINDYEKHNKITKQWSDNLRKQTEYAYYDKFIKEANYVFSKSVWTSYEINSIKKELKRLGKSDYIENKQSLNPLNKIIVEYNSVVTFLAKVKSYSSSNPIPNIDDTFNSGTVVGHIKKALDMSSTESKIKNNQSLMSRLKNVKSLMLSKHIIFLNNKLKIIKLEDCDDFRTYSSFFQDVCQPVFDDINEFKPIANNRYGCKTSDWYGKINKISSGVAKVASDSKKNPCLLK